MTGRKEKADAEYAKLSEQEDILLERASAIMRQRCIAMLGVSEEEYAYMEGLRGKNKFALRLCGGCDRRIHYARLSCPYCDSVPDTDPPEF